MVLRACTTRQQLRSKADAQNGGARQRCFIHQPGQFRQIGMRGICQCVLLSAKHHKCIKLRHVGQTAILPRCEHINPRARHMQGNANLTVMGNGGIFHDGNAHGRLSAARTLRHLMP